jgi:hypothetical protein
LALIGLEWISPYLHVPDALNHILLVLTAMVGVHLIERMWVWDDVVEQFSRLAKDIVTDSTQLSASASRVGLVRLYVSREAAVSDVKREIRRAKSRVWLLGVSLSARMTLSSVLDDLLKHIDLGHDVRLLVIDPLRSPAVFRALLENDADTVDAILHKGEEGIHTYFQKKLFLEVQKCAGLIQDHDQLAARAKFYAPNPSCWLVVADDTVFFEPYTFGKCEDAPKGDPCLGEYMPVFKFRKQQGGRPFEILCDHFDKIWRTSDTDIFHFEANQRDAKRIVKKVLDHRRAWFEHVFNALHNNASYANTCDRRSHPRQEPFAVEPQLIFELSWKNGSGAISKSSASLRDFSAGGLSFVLNGAALPTVGDELTISRKVGALHVATELKVSKLGISINGSGSFIVRWARLIHGQPVVGVGLIKRVQAAAG